MNKLLIIPNASNATDKFWPPTIITECINAQLEMEPNSFYVTLASNTASLATDLICVHVVQSVNSGDALQYTAIVF